VLGELSLGLGDYAIIGGMLAIPVTLVIFNLRSLGERVGKVEREKASLDHVLRVETRVQDMETRKVGVKDWVRIVASQTNRANRIAEQLATIEGKLDAQMGIGGQLRRIAEAVEKKPENSNAAV